MKAKIIGIKPVDFTPEGKDRIQGTKLFLALYKTSDKSLIGASSYDAWLTPERTAIAVQSFGVLSVGDLVDKPCDVAFDEKGKLDVVSPVAVYGAKANISDVPASAPAGKPGK